jgi:putative membrane protein
MWLDAVLAYLHYLAIFTLVSLLAIEIFLIRGTLDARLIRLLGRVDLAFGGASLAVLVTGFLRLGLGAKGADFYLGAWPIYVKVGLFLLVGMISVYPTLAFVRWRRALDHDAQWQVPAGEQRRMRRLVMIEVHLAALIPVFAVIMSRGLGR